ncbi:MAG: DUF3267 domain-containing protein [Bacteroidales bacterium]|nr:DUF3267 domain-containing protein [Bacteroidales bacterium]
MTIKVKDLEDQSKYRQINKIHYDDLITFVLEYLKRRTGLMVFFWSACIIMIGLALTIRVNIAGYFPLKEILIHSLLGLVVFPILIIPVHEFMHIIPFWIIGAKRIRIGMDLKQYMFYVTAHRHVVPAGHFRLIGLFPFIMINLCLIVLILFLPGLWKWSLSLLLLVHTTMCAGDFAMMNFFHLHRNKKTYTWDDADEKVAYFYEEI